MYDDIYVNFSTVDNDDMKSSKRHAVFLSLIFLLKMYIKTNEILAFIATVKKVSFLHVESSSISCFVKFADFYRNVLLYLIPSLMLHVMLQYLYTAHITFVSWRFTILIERKLNQHYSNH